MSRRRHAVRVTIGEAAGAVGTIGGAEAAAVMTVIGVAEVAATVGSDRGLSVAA